MDLGIVHYNFSIRRYDRIMVFTEWFCLFHPADTNCRVVPICKCFYLFNRPAGCWLVRHVRSAIHLRTRLYLSIRLTNFCRHIGMHRESRQTHLREQYDLRARSYHKFLCPDEIRLFIFP